LQEVNNGAFTTLCPLIAFRDSIDRFLNLLQFELLKQYLNYSFDKTIKLWQLDTGKITHPLVKVLGYTERLEKFNYPSLGGKIKYSNLTY
jgi:hypothetical protein